jgi:ribose transport system permease protein
MTSQSVSLPFVGSAWRSRVVGAVRDNTYVFALVLSVALLIANTAVLPAFASWSQVPSELGTLAPSALAAMASAPSILSGGGGVDLSIAPLMGLVNIILVTGLLSHGLGNPAVAVPLLLALGGAIGAVNGALVAILRYPPVIATLAVYFVLGGIDLRLAPDPVSTNPNWTNHLASTLWHVPGTIFTVGVVLILWFLFRRTAYYGTLFAVGDYDIAAYASGVNVPVVRIIAYTLGGILAAVAGIALTGTIQSADVTVWPFYVLIALAAVALGGNALGGGRGGFVGPTLGATAVFLIQNLLTALGVDVFYVQVLYGAVLVAAVVAGAFLNSSEGSSRSRRRRPARSTSL